MEIDRRIHFKVGEISKEEMTWEEAKAYAEKQGMRLPTRIELLTMIEQGVKIPGWCWTCEEYSAAHAWRVHHVGIAYYYLKYLDFYAMPVRNL